MASEPNRLRATPDWRRSRKYMVQDALSLLQAFYPFRERLLLQLDLSPLDYEDGSQ